MKKKIKKQENNTSLSNAFETSLATLLFNNTNIDNVGDATGLRGSSTAGSLYVSLHTDDPGEAGTQATSECNYPGYARVAVARTSGGWTVSGNTVSNTAEIAFATNNSGSTVTITHFAIGLESSGATVILCSGTAAYSATNGTTPRFQAGQLTVTLD